MKNIFFSFLFVLSTVSVAAYPPFSYYQTAHDAVNITLSELQSVGCETLSPNDPRLPYPQVSAIEAIVNFQTGALTYYDEETGAYAANYVFKNRQGGNRHRITFSEDSIQFVTPYAGTIAHSNRFKTVGGWDYNFYCQSSLVDKATWDGCIHQLFIDVLKRQMMNP